ncbi:MAG: helix-turn-helix domain-containing protein [Bacteroidota bacterium]|nr:helix-turn-helix domain-containing protein [Bacteroidota bacterium]
MNDLKRKICKQLKEERIEAGLSQVELATRCGTTKNYLSRLENEK